MQKDSFLLTNTEAPVVQFSKLDENNKAQFLEFLIKNNITFDNAPGKQNVIAKVTLRTQTPNKNNINKVTNNQNSKTFIKKGTQKTKKNKYQGKENNQNFQAIKKSVKNTKSTLKTQNNYNNQKKSKDNISPLKKSKPIRQQDEKLTKSPKNIHNSQVSLRGPRDNDLLKGKTMNIEMKQKLGDIKNQTLISPAKSNRKMNEKSHEKVVSTRDLNSSVSRSVKNVSFTKQSHQRLSNFKKQISPKTFRQTNLLQESKAPTYVTRESMIKNKPKIRNKIPTQQSKLNQSRESISFSRERSKDKNSVNLNSLRNQSYQSLNRMQLVNKYKEYFSNFNSNNSPNSTCIKQRPVCWPLTQVEKFLDEFYEDSFIKNTNQIMNGSKKFNETLKNGSNPKKSHIAQALQKYLNRKFNKVQKAIEYNLVNLLYSVAFYINQYKEQTVNEQNPSIIGLSLFQAFLFQKYQLQDYLFFLFCKNILKHDFKKLFIASTSLVNINKKQIDKFLKHIVGQNNTEILKEYHQMIFQKVPNYEIEINNFMKILIQDYKIKRQASQQSYRQKVKNQQHLSSECLQSNCSENEQDSQLQNTFNKILGFGCKNYPKGDIFQNSGHLIQEDSMDELTFGQDTKDMLREVDIESKHNCIAEKQKSSFWQSPYINQKNAEAEKERLLKDEFNQMIAQKLCQKTHQLVKLLSTNSTNEFPHTKKSSNKICYFQNQDQSSQSEDQNEWQEVEQLLFSKALCLFFTVIEMNKVKWLKQLYIQNPSQQDIEKVEQIQLFFRKIKQIPSAKDIAQFCKLILTINQITEELSKFFL